MLAALRQTIQSIMGKEIWTTRSLIPSHIKPSVMQSLPSEKLERATDIAWHSSAAKTHFSHLMHKPHYSPFLYHFPAFLSLSIAFLSILHLSLPPLFCILLYQATTYSYNGWTPSPHILLAHPLFFPKSSGKCYHPHWHLWEIFEGASAYAPESLSTKRPGLQSFKYLSLEGPDGEGWKNLTKKKQPKLNSLSFFEYSPSVSLSPFYCLLITPFCQFPLGAIVRLMQSRTCQ